jgi:hypothetical protein
MRIPGIVALCVALGGCGSGNQALLASGGADDFAAMRYVTDEYQSAEPDAIIPIDVAGEPYSFRVWLHKAKPRIMVQTASMTAAATAGFVRGLSGGLVKAEQEYEPMKQAALSYLATTRDHAACTVTISQKIARVGWEWDFECSAPPATKRRKH